MEWKKIRSLVLAASLTLALGACTTSGDDDDDDHAGATPDPTTETQPAQRTGVFVDNAVSGLAYSTPTRSGVTDALGRFSYLSGETVTFTLGGITLGAAAGAPAVTPVSLVPGAVDSSNPVVGNLLRFIQTLDSDSDPSNGITVTEAVRESAAAAVLSFDGENFAEVAQGVLGAIGVQAPLITLEQARAHFDPILAQIEAGTFTLPGGITLDDLLPEGTITVGGGETSTDGRYSALEGVWVAQDSPVPQVFQSDAFGNTTSYTQVPVLGCTVVKASPNADASVSADGKVISYSDPNTPNNTVTLTISADGNSMTLHNSAPIELTITYVKGSASDIPADC